MKKRGVALITVFLILSFLLSPTLANDYEENESWYINTCYDPVKAKENQSACKGYSKYVAEKREEAKQNIDKIKDEIKSLEGEIEEQILLVEVYKKQINALDIEIAQKEAKIVIFENNIIRIESDIEEANQEITDIDNIIKQRLVDQQSKQGLNTYVDYIMKADDLVDLITRYAVANDIVEFEDQAINKLEELLAELDNLKTAYVTQKEEMELDKKEVENSRAAVAELKTTSDRLIASYLAKQAELEEKENYFAQDMGDYSAIIKNIDKALEQVTPSYGWIDPIPSARKSAGTWFYPSSFGNGALHLGLDLAAPVGTPVRAVANGVVLYRANSCSTSGYLGSTCGYPGTWGGGNQVYLLVNVNDSLYAVKYIHLKYNTAIAIGTSVQAGDKIAELGNTGNSSGPHTHIEIFYLGKRTIKEYMNSWNGDLSFGAGMGSTGYNNRCDARGGAAPCRIRPESVFGR